MVEWNSYFHDALMKSSQMTYFRRTQLILIPASLLLACLLAVSAYNATGDTSSEFQKEKYYLVGDRIVAEYLPNVRADNVKSLRLERAMLTDRDLETIGKFKNLQKLDLWDCNLTDEKMNVLRSLLQIESLEIIGTRLERLPKITDEGAQNIGALTRLRRLKLYCPELTDDGLEFFALLPQLRHLDLSSNQVRGPGLKHLENAHSLSWINLNCPVGDDSTKHLSSFPQLRGISLYRTQVTDTGLKALVDNPWLLSFSPSRKMTAEALRDFRNAVLDRRRKARLAGKDVPWDDSLFIQNRNHRLSGNIAFPDVYPSSGDDSQTGPMKFINESEKEAWQVLRTHGARVHLSSNHFRSSETKGSFIESITLHGDFPKQKLLPLLARLSRLNRLYITATPMSVEDINTLSEAKSLTVLNLSKCGLDDEALKHIGKLERLKVLILAQNPITDAGLENLAALESLETVSLSATKIRGSGLDRLHKDLPLKQLSVSSTNLDDTGIKNVLRFRHLSSLDCDGTLVTKRGIFELAKLHWLSQISATDILGNDEIEQFHKLRAAVNESARRSGQPIPDSFDSPFDNL
jgi:hypothetical protein